jgi:fibronectin-binding autotransporter adhesin
MHRSIRGSSARVFPKLKSQVVLAAATAAATAFSSRAFATNYSLTSTFSTGGTWSNTAIWSPTPGVGGPGASDSIVQSAGLAANGTITLDAAGDLIFDLSYNNTTSSASLAFISNSSTASTLTVGDVITKSGTGGALSFGSSTNPITLAGPGGGGSPYASLDINGTNLGNNTVNFYNSNSLATLTFAAQGDLRSNSQYNTGTTALTTVTIQNNVVIDATDIEFRMLQSGTSNVSPANFAVVGNLTGTLSNGEFIEIDDSNASAAAANNTFTLEGAATGLTVSGTAAVLFGTGATGGGSQYKYATLLLANGSALANVGTPISVDLGNAGSINTSSSSYVGLNLVSSGAYSFNNPINVEGLTETGSITQAYTIGAQNGLGTTATFSGPVVIGSGSITTNLQVSSTYSGATLAFTGNISQASATYNQAVTVTGSGVVILSGSNTYGGGTTVNSGATLLLNNTKGSGTGTGSVNVAGVLSGTGTISGALNTTATSATIQPGAAGMIGTLHTGALTLLDNSTFAVAINSNSVNGTTGSSSELISGGTVTLGTSAFALLSVTDLGSTLLPANDVFTIIQSANPITTAFQNLPEGTDVTYGGNTFAISYLGDDVTLTTVTPEPSAMALLAICAMGMLGRRRRQQQTSSAGDRSVQHAQS